MQNSVCTTMHDYRKMIGMAFSGPHFREMPWHESCLFSGSGFQTKPEINLLKQRADMICARQNMSAAFVYA